MPGGPEYPVLGGVENKKGAGVSQGAPFGQSSPYSTGAAPTVLPPFISSVTSVYAPTFAQGEVFPSFISSATALYAPTVAYTGQVPVVTVSGTFQWLCPAGITAVYVQCFGGGGGGSDGSGSLEGGAGGGGGAYASKASISVTPGTLYTFIVGAGGVRAVTTATDGGDSSFTGDSSNQVLAKGGHGGVRSPTTGGTGGSAASSIGDTTHSGGDGFQQAGSGNGGGGGASGNRTGTGASATGRPGATGANEGGSGGNGGLNGSNGSAGGLPGGGAGGGGQSASGANGGAGGVSIITFKRTQSSIARILNTAVTKTQTAKVRVQAAVTKTQTAKVRVRSTLVKLQTSIARISKTLTKTQTAISRVQATVTRAQTSTARITASSTKTQTATAHISSVVDIHPPFIPSTTHVWSIFSLFDPNLTFTGPGNGGETFGLRLNENGITTTATLATAIGVGGTPSLTMTGDSGMPTDASFVVTIDSEQILVVPQGAGAYLIRQRPMGNTSTASHSPGATVSWGDSYDMTIVSNTNINTDFTADIEGTGSSLYTGFLMAFDSSQAYKTDGSRFPLHVTEFMGVFVAGAGVSGTSKVDGSQPSAIHAPESASDHCGAALTVPALITADIVPGDVIVVRYTNPAAFVLDLGPRSGAIQSWFGLKRVDTSDNDVTYTDPNGIVVDTKSGYFTYTGSVNTEPDEPIPNVVGIAPDASDLAGYAIPTPSAVPWLTVTLPGTDRYFTDSIHYSERGWPIGVLSCRQGNRRIPLWQSWDWHNFSYVYSGFGTDDSFAQVVINRNGMLGVLPTISLPGPQDIDGPDAVWDDGTYYFGASWYVVLVATPYLVAGPIIGGIIIVTGPDSPAGGIPSVTFPGGSGSPPVITPPTIEGGSGGDISPSSTGLNVWQIF